MKRKEKPSQSVKKLIEWAQSQGLWMFFKDDLLLNILPCITDFTDEVRSTTFDLLMEFSKWPSSQRKFFESDFVLQYSHFLCNHPDYRSNDGGAHLLCLIYEKKFIELETLGMFVDETPSDIESNRAVGFLMDILERAKMQLDVAKENFSRAAFQSPIHGLLLALQYCLHNSKDFLKNYFQNRNEASLSFIKCVTDLCDDIIDYMINIMKGNEKENCPSFSDIGIALEKLISSTQTQALDSSEIDSVSAETQEQDGRDQANSPKLDLLLSCCWHSIKNSCYLLCELSTFICGLNLDYKVKEQLLQNIAVKLSTILITCRHRGVVDACSLALNKFCKMLLKDEELYETICKFLLNLVFSSLLDASNTSVTRRSAGLPCLCQAVVSSEVNNIKRKLLSFTIEKLLNCIHQPLLPTELISDKTDLSQAHAYHILKALVMDSSLSQAILSHTDAIIPACVSGFSSTLWPIRNGALQLFGVLLPRICGQKKVRDEDSEHNLVSASELFARCPSLRTYLLEQLAKCVQFHHKKELCSELVPVLSIIAKLSPPQDDNENLMTEFKTLLLELLDMPVWKVRDLVSSALSVMVTEKNLIELFETIREEKKLKSLKTNKVHGSLLVLQKVLKKDIHFISDCNALWITLQELYQLLSERKCSLLLGFLLDIILMISSERTTSTKIWFHKLDTHDKHSVDIGYAIYKSKVALLQFKMSEIWSDPSMHSLPFTENIEVSKEFLEFLTLQLHSDRNQGIIYSEEKLHLWREIYVYIVRNLHNVHHPSIIQDALTFLIDLCYDWKVGSYVLCSGTSSFEASLWSYLDMESGLSVTALSLTMLSLCLKSDLKKRDVSAQLEKWNMLFNFYSQPRSPDILRMQAACSVACFGPQLAEYFEEKIQNGCETAATLFIGLCEGSLLLLQDEDEEIRNKACEFPSNIPHKYEINCLQFNIGIQIVLEYMLILLKDDSNFLLYLWNRLQNYPSAAKILYSSGKTMKMNLFEQEYVNVFAEPMMLILTYQKYLEIILKELHQRNYNDWLERVEMFSHDTKVEIKDLLLVLSIENPSRFNPFSQGFANPHQVFLALKKLYCQMDALQAQKHLVPSDYALHSFLQEMATEWEYIEKRLPVITSWFLHQL